MESRTHSAPTQPRAHTTHTPARPAPRPPPTQPTLQATLTNKDNVAEVLGVRRGRHGDARHLAQHDAVSRARKDAREARRAAVSRKEVERVCDASLTALLVVDLRIFVVADDEVLLAALGEDSRGLGHAEVCVRGPPDALAATTKARQDRERARCGPAADAIALGDEQLAVGRKREAQAPCGASAPHSGGGQGRRADQRGLRASPRELVDDNGVRVRKGDFARHGADGDAAESGAAREDREIRHALRAVRDGEQGEGNGGGGEPRVTGHAGGGPRCARE